MLYCNSNISQYKNFTANLSNLILLSRRGLAKPLFLWKMSHFGQNATFCWHLTQSCKDIVCCVLLTKIRLTDLFWHEVQHVFFLLKSKWRRNISQNNDSFTVIVTFLPSCQHYSLQSVTGDSSILTQMEMQKWER